MKVLVVSEAMPPVVVVAVRLYVPFAEILQPVKLTVPADAVRGFAEVQVSVADPDVMESVILLLLFVVTTLPPASSIATVWVPRAVLWLPLLGVALVKFSCVAGPTVMLKGLLAADVKLPSVAVRV